jgi:nucleotide-binding universal stress UspA family protein
MTHEQITHIICAVRGVPESRETVVNAIDLALEHNARLTFFLVINAEFLAQAAPTSTPLRVVYKQLEEMGQFSMLILVDRAQRRGVAQVDHVVRLGDVRAELPQYARETDAEIVVLGRPTGQRRHAVFTPTEFDDFVHGLEEDANVRVVQVMAGKAGSDESN